LTVGAKRPDGKAARTDRVTFTRPAAERIGRVVRIVEAGDRGAEGLTFTPRMTGGGGIKFRICTFTGSWSIGSSNTVTFKYQTTTPNTVSATNLFWPLDENDSSERDCSIGKDGTAWFLLVPQLFRGDFFTAATTTQCGIKFETLPGIALASHSTNTFTMQVQTVPVVTAASIGTAGLSLDRLNVGVFCSSTTDSIVLGLPGTATTTVGTVAVTVVTSVTMTDTAIKFSRRTITVFSDTTATDVEVPITTCATATAS